MADGTQNIYIDLSFLYPSSGTTNAFIDYTLHETDNIGVYTIPFIFQTGSSGTATQDQIFNYVLSTSTSGFTSTVISYDTGTSAASGILNTCLLDYSIPITSSGLINEIDSYLKYYTGLTKVSGNLDPRMSIIVGDAYNYSNNILENYWAYGFSNYLLDFYALYTAGNDYDYTDPFDYVVISGIRDCDSLFTMGTLISGAGLIPVFIDSRFAGYVFKFKPDDLSYRFDNTCGIISTSYYYHDTTVISGGVLAIDFDLFSTQLASKYYDSLSFCCLQDMARCLGEIQTISGSIGYYDFELYSSYIGINSINFDVDLLSLKISNFSLTDGEFLSASSAICVDITDDVFNVVTSGTFFIIDGVTTSGTFYAIDDGYRMCYDPNDNFISLLGSTTFTVHAENNNGDVLERDYYLTFGYLVEYDNREQDYGYDSRVVVRMSAENFASCPLFSHDAYYFTTVEKSRGELTADIMGIPWSTKELSADIIPNTELMFVYGKTFTVELRVKDYAGNEMAPYIFEFKIEDAP